MYRGHKVNRHIDTGLVSHRKHGFFILSLSSVCGISIILWLFVAFPTVMKPVVIPLTALLIAFIGIIRFIFLYVYPIIA